MSIATEIQRLQNAKASIKTSIENKGVVVSSSDTLDDYADYIDAINISTQEKTITPQNQTHEITADSGYRGLSKVILDGILVDAHDSYTTSTDSTTAYTKTVPSGALKYANIDKLGGMSYKSENLAVLDDVAETTTNGITYKVENGAITLDGTATSTTRLFFALNNTIVNGNNYAYNQFTKNTGYSVYLSPSNSSTDAGNLITASNTTPSTTFTANNDFNYLYLYIANGSVITIGTFTPMLIEGSTVPTVWKQGFTNIRDSAVTSVVSKDSNDTTIETFNIPAEIQALDGYGFGVNDTCYNYIDFETKKFIKKVGRVDLGTLSYRKNNTADSNLKRFGTDVNGIKPSANNNAVANILCAKYNATYSNATYNNTIGIAVDKDGVLFIYDSDLSSLTPEEFAVAMSGVYLYYELATPVETDISAYIDDNFIEVGAGGSITANNTYNQAVPSEITYLVEV